MFKRCALTLVFAMLAQFAHASERVTFPSADGKTTLTGYLYLPPAPRGRVPAIVMMHGRAGAYSSLANGVYDAAMNTKIIEWSSRRAHIRRAALFHGKR